jgi:Gram-negative porin
MKKTLVAVAALALVSGAFAQSAATVSGKFAFAYTSGKSGAGVKSSGFGVTDGNITFAASEDLGGGMKAGASMDVRVRGRANNTLAAGNNAASSSVDGRDAYVYISGGFGEIRGGAVDAQYQTLIDLAHPLQGAALDSCNTKFNCGDATVDMLQYTSPSMGGLTASLMLADATGGGGQQSTAATRDSVQLGLAYSNGPINAGFEYTSFGLNAASAVTNSKNRYRLSGNYNLGVVTLGAGFGSEKYAAYTQKEYSLGFAAPLGPVTVGLNWVSAKSNGTTESGWEAVADYALSKRTSVQVSYRSEDANLASNLTLFRTRLMHKF